MDLVPGGVAYVISILTNYTIVNSVNNMFVQIVEFFCLNKSSAKLVVRYRIKY